MCLPELLMDCVIIKGDALRQCYIVSRHIDVTGCDVMFSCYAIWLLIKDMAETKPRLDCMAEVTDKKKNFHGVSKNHREVETNRLPNFIMWQFCLFSNQ